MNLTSGESSMSITEQVSRELFESVTDQILEKLEKFEAKFDRVWDKNDTIDKQIQSINLAMATQNVDELKKVIEKLQGKVERLETFKTKVLTSLFIVQMVLTAVIGGLNVYYRAR